VIEFLSLQYQNPMYVKAVFQAETCKRSMGRSSVQIRGDRLRVDDSRVTTSTRQTRHPSIGNAPPSHLKPQCLSSLDSERYEGAEADVFYVNGDEDDEVSACCTG
jgi:hypothetical protein